MSSFNIIIGTAIFLLIIFSLISSTVQYVPFDEKTVFSKQFPYEGFEPIHHPLDYSTNSNQSALDTYQSFLVNGDNTDCKKVYGFDGLYCKPSVKDANIDIYSSASGDSSCFGKSSGLSNSRGSLCLDKNQKNMLTTRGQNATGRDSEIGK